MKETLIFQYSAFSNMWNASTKWLKVITICLCFILVKPEKKECIEARCSRHGPEIRFPFRLTGIQPQHCGYSRSFELSCTKENKTMLQLPTSANFYVNKIDYKSQIIHISDPNTCISRLIRNVNLSSSPFRYAYDEIMADYDVFSCTSETDIDLFYATSLPSCLNGSDHKLYAVGSWLSIDEVTLISCTKMYKLVSIPSVSLLKGENKILLSWSTPNCYECEAKGNKCRLNSNSTEPEIECHRIKSTKGLVTKLVISGSIIGTFLLAIVAFVLYFVHQKNKVKEENQVKIDKFLADYEAFKPTRYSYVDIKRITNQFGNELGQGAYGTVYKGKLSDEVHVAVKVLNNSKGKGEEFINEVGIIGKIHHINVVRLVGFCADGFRRALVYEFLPNGSLQKFISRTDEERSYLGWEKMKDIALGIAKGIEYLHQGCNQRILHFDIKPHNVLLDRNFSPKVSDFGTAKLCSKDQSVVSMTTARGTMGYISPEVFSRNFGDVSYKSDVYSFGMLLLEMVGSRRKVTDISLVENESQFYLPEWIYKRLDQGENLEIDIDEENDVQIAKKLAIVGLWCIQWQPANRPSMSVVVKMFEGKERLEIPPNPFAKGLAAKKNNNVSNLPGRFVQLELSVISES